jgi:hypothetical protein
MVVKELGKRATPHSKWKERGEKKLPEKDPLSIQKNLLSPFLSICIFVFYWPEFESIIPSIPAVAVAGRCELRSVIS